MRFYRLAVLLMLFPIVCWGGSGVLLDETKLSALIAKESDYQLLDARSSAMQRSAPIAFSTVYRINTPISNGLVLVVADDDRTATEIAESIPAAINRSVYAVQGGSEMWQKVITNAPASRSTSDSFVIPKNTCEQGKPIQKLQRDKTLK